MSITYTNVHHCVHFGLLYQSTTIVVLFSPQSTIVLIHFHTPNIATTANKRTNTSCHQGGWKLGSAILNPTKLTRVNKIYRVDSMLRIICSPCYCSRELAGFLPALVEVIETPSKKHFPHLRCYSFLHACSSRHSSQEELLSIIFQFGQGFIDKLSITIIVISARICAKMRTILTSNQFFCFSQRLLSYV